jgi:2-amino-4-hydroxy-6-hydroxymethyldihydropteridine diphosphokinase
MARMEGYVALGSNLGDREAHLRAGLDGMARSGIEPLECSSMWETEPVDSDELLVFLNMVARVRTDLSPLTVLERLLEIERVAGRVRGRRNEPRVLDLDLLLLGDLQVHDSRLVVPHPRMWTRRFVLAPLEELAPDLRNPATLMTVRETLQDLDERPWARLAAPVAGPV